MRHKIKHGSKVKNVHNFVIRHIKNKLDADFSTSSYNKIMKEM